MKHLLSSLFILFSVAQAGASTTISGAITKNTTWAYAGSPYLISGKALVDSGVILTISPGVTVVFDTAASLQINGTLLAAGTADSQITFTGNKAKSGYWGYIYFNKPGVSYNDSAKTGCNMQYCTVEYAGILPQYSNTIAGAISLNDVRVYFNHCTFRNQASSCIDGAFFTTSGNENIDHCRFYDNGGTAVSFYTQGFITVNTNITNSYFYHNNPNAGGGGGAISLAVGRATIKINNDTIISNHATGGGGGIAYSSASYIDISNNLICFNKSDYNGGGLYVINYNGNGPAARIFNNIIYGNEAEMGGGIFHAGFSIFNNVIANNRATSAFSAVSGQTHLFFHNHIIDNSDLGAIAEYGDDEFEYNTITRNSTDTSKNYSTTLFNYNYQPVTGGLPPADFFRNNIYGNHTRYEMFNNEEFGSGYNATSCYWGYTDSASIAAVIHDHADDSFTTVIKYENFEKTPDTVAPVCPPAGFTKKNVGGGKLQLAWNANLETDIKGYKIFWGSPTGYSFSHSLDAGNVTGYTLSGFAITDTIAIIAYDSSYDPTNTDFTNMYRSHESWYTYATGSPKAGFTATATTTCAGDTIQFFGSTSDTFLYANSQWVWSFPGGVPDSSREMAPKVVYPKAGNFNVKLVLTNVAGIDSVLKANYITINSAPPVSLAPFKNVCANAATFALSGGLPAGGQYSGICVVHDSFEVALTAKYSYDTFRITYTYTSPGGCGTVSTSQLLTIAPVLANAQFTEKTHGTQAVFTPADTDMLSYTWQFGDSGSSGSVHPTHIYPSNGRYPVQLTVVDKNGCVAADTQTIVINYTGLPSIVQGRFNVIFSPDPFHDFTTLHVVSPIRVNNLVFILYDVTGREMLHQENITNTPTIIMRGNLAAGVYWYTLSGEEGIVARGKIVAE